MKKKLLFALVVLLGPSFASAHVSVRPRESKPGAEERYTVRVPTEGDVSTTHVVLEIPSDLTVLEVVPAEGATFDVSKQGSRISAITWRKEIAPKGTAEFVFRARNPMTTEIAWKAHQHFSDGSVADWIGPAGDRRPASVTKLSAAIAAALEQAIADLLPRSSHGSGPMTWPSMRRISTSSQAFTIRTSPSSKAVASTTAGSTIEIVTSGLS